MPARIIAAQAVDQDITNLRELSAVPRPELSVSSNLVILGGITPETSNVVQHLGKVFAPYYKSFLQATTREDLQAKQIPKSCSILCLSDFDTPFWLNIIMDRFEKFKNILFAANCLV